MAAKYKSTLIALDIESTDLSPEKGEIIEVAVVKYRGGKEVDSFSTLLKPERGIPPVITSITGITQEDVADSPFFSEVADKVQQFIGDFPIIGHNIEFDVNFLRANNIPLKNNDLFDTWKLSTIVFQGAKSFSLEALTARLGLSHKEKHRALDDAKAGMELFYHLFGKLQEVDRDVIDSINNLAAVSTWPLQKVFREVAKFPKVSETKSKKRQTGSVKKSVSDLALKDIPGLFEKNGILTKKISGYEYRPSQVKMIKLVAAALAEDKFSLIETPPGVGKSMAYLLPTATFAKKKGEQVIISTYTRSLQDQLAYKDLETVQQITPFDFTWAILKGRNQYLCQRLFHKLEKRANLSNDEITTLAKIFIWLDKTSTGEFDELAQTREDRPIIRRITSDHHTCQGSHCPHKGDCFVNRARKKAQKADLVIVNHALLLREPMVENEPVLTASRLVIDEAHELEGAATDAFSRALTKDMVEEWLRFLANPRKKGGLLDAFPRHKYPDLATRAQEIKQQVMMFFNESSLFFGLVGIFAKRYEDGGRYMTYEVSLTNQLRHQPEWDRVLKSADNMIAKLGSIISDLRDLSEQVTPKDKKVVKSVKEWSRDIKSQCQEGENLQKLWDELILSPKEDYIYWLNVRKDEYFTLKAAPKRVSERLLDTLYAEKKTVILTSATMSTATTDETGLLESSFDHFKDRLGLEDFEFSRLSDVFDYHKQALIYLPQDVSGLKSPSYTQDLADTILNVAREIGGKTMVLFTSYRAIKSVYEKISPELKKAKIDLFAQGVTGGKMKLLQQFKSSEKGVLLGTNTFWQGVDIPGEKLSCLIMAKLPFDVPSDPVFQARQEEYSNGFMDYSVPLAILRFRQGFGRLIRTKTDRGVMIIMDSRVEKARYGMMFLRSLPAAEVKYGSLSGIPEVTKNWLAKK